MTFLKVGDEIDKNVFLLLLLSQVHGILRRSSSFNTGRIEHLYQNRCAHTAGRKGPVLTLETKHTEKADVIIDGIVNYKILYTWSTTKDKNKESSVYVYIYILVSLVLHENPTFIVCQV